MMMAAGDKRLATDSMEAVTLYRAASASVYTYQQLADIYNQTRVDYIVPMPMNARRMEEYVTHYDIDLSASVLALDGDGEVGGVGMLGLREGRAWLTRLGVMPDRRRHRLGQFMMENLLAQAVARQSFRAQLEVIRGNEPAHTLFRKLGFYDVRELLVVRRPPAPPEGAPPPADITPLSHDQIAGCICSRAPIASWLDEPASLLRAGSLRGYRAVLANGGTGWVVFRDTPFVLTHVVMDATPGAEHEAGMALLHHLHAELPRKDTKVENIPADSPFWPAYYALGYRETFRRVEMLLPLS
jgi:ribosomal protein S18 acetylase RimI-like enzyme